MPLLIIAGVVAAVAVIAGWQISTALGGIPFWVWAVGGIAVFYLFSQTSTGKKATGVAGTATKIYLTKGMLKNPRKRMLRCQ